jgi:hypothetical protein
MGWADCGTDSDGRPIGYAFEATCDEPGCEEKIDRGVSYACGNMHGDGDGYGCEKYFCPAHLRGSAPDGAGKMRLVCMPCEAQWRREKPDEAAAYDNE